MKLNRNAKQLLEKQIQVILNSSGKSGSSGRWPMPVLKTTNEASIHSEPFVAESFYKKICRLKERGYTKKQISQLFPYPSGLARLTMIFRSRMIWSLNKKQQLEMYNDLADVLSNIYKSNKFCYDGKNIIWSITTQKKIFARLRKNKKIIPIETITQLDGRLWLYSEMIFSRWHNLAHEFHGPYNSKEKLLVKEWHDLKGPFKNKFKDFPYQNIICYEFYKNNSITLDIHNRSITKKPLADTVTKAFVELDGKFIDNKSVQKLIKIIDIYLIKGAKYLAKLNKVDLKIYNAFMEFYSIKPLADEIRQNWKPPLEVYSSIRRKILPSRTNQMLKKLQYYYSRNTIKNIKIQYDPSKDFK